MFIVKWGMIFGDIMSVMGWVGVGVVWIIGMVFGVLYIVFYEIYLRDIIFVIYRLELNCVF